MSGLWNSERLCSLIEMIIDKRGVTPLKLGSSFSDNGHRVISAKNIKNRRVDLATGEKRYIDAATYAKWMKEPLEIGDVLLTSEAPLGEPAYISNPVNWVLGQRLFAIRTNPDKLLGQFLYYALQTGPLRDDLLSRATGSVAQGIRQSELLEVTVIYPEISEQRRIAEILGALDDKIELNRRMAATLEEIGRAIFKSWFVDFDPVRAKAEGRPTGLPPEIDALFPDSLQDSELGQIPTGWETRNLASLTDFALGGDWGKGASSEIYSAEALCIRGADIPALQSGGFGRMPARFLKQSSLEKRRLCGGDLVIEISGGSPTQSTGRIVLINAALLERRELPLVCSNFCRLIRPKGSDYSLFIYFWMRALYEQDDLYQYETGTTGIKNFAFAYFSESNFFALPSGDLLRCFSELCSCQLTKRTTLGAESEILTSARDTLLPMLISGELPAAGGSNQ